MRGARTTGLRRITPRKPVYRRGPIQLFRRRRQLLPSVLSAAAYTEPLQDTASTADALLDLRAAAEPLQDTGSTADAISDSLPVSEPLADTATTADAVSDLQAQPEALDDTASTADAISDSLPVSEPLADTATTGDAATEVQALAEPLGDTASTGDAAAEALALAEPLADTAASADAVVDETPSGEDLIDSASTGDALTDVQAQLEALTDTASSGDTASDTYTPALTNKWHDYPDDFPGTEFTAAWTHSGQKPVVGSNKVAFTMSSGWNGSFKTATTHELTESFVAIKAEPNVSYGYLEFQVTRNSGSTIVGSAFVRADTGLLYVYYNGSTRATFTYVPADHEYWRWSSTGGNLSFDTWNGSAWASLWSDASAGATFDLTTIGVVFNGGSAVGGAAPDTSHKAYVSKFNIAPASSGTSDSEPLADTASTGDSAAELQAALAPVADTASTADELVTLVARGEPLADTASTADALATVEDYEESLGDFATSADTANDAAGNVEAASDDATSDDNVATLLALSPETAPDAATSADAAADTHGRAEALADASAATSTATDRQDSLAVLADAASTADSLIERSSADLTFPESALVIRARDFGITAAVPDRSITATLASYAILAHRIPASSSSAAPEPTAYVEQVLDASTTLDDVSSSGGLADVVIEASTSLDEALTLLALVETAEDLLALVDALTDEAGATGYNLPVTHGKQLQITDVGPWALQGVPKGSETLQAMTGPGRGFWRFSDAIEFTNDDAWPADDSDPEALNDPNLHQGKVVGSPMVIDGYTVPVGTYICQFRDFPNHYDFYAQGTSLPIMFRGCRFRFTAGVGGSGLFNDSGSTSAQRILLHYCDIGLTSANLANGASGLMIVKFLGGQNHRVHRNYHTNSSTFYQPNTQGCVFTENYITDFIFAYGEAGTSGLFDSTVTHMNGISSEGAITDLTIARNHITAPSPDPTAGIALTGGTAAGQVNYGTQPGQVGYGSGSTPGRVIGQTDCIALFTAQGENVGSSPGAILIADNYLGGTGVPIYAGGTAAQNVHVSGNRLTTKWWTDGGQSTAITDVPTWGSNGNAESDNLWDDDYGTGGDGSTPTSERQYPSGNGLRVGTSFV